MPKKQDFILPSLFDRLTDLEPRRLDDLSFNSSFDIKKYKETVLRDILLLLNTTNIQGFISCDSFPTHVEGSTVNYGISAFSGINFSDIDWSNLSMLIKKCLVNFEPRLDPNTIKVEVILNKANIERFLSIHIYGVLMLTPYREEFFLKTNMDVELGVFKLEEVRS